MMLHTFSTLGCPELNLDEVMALAGRHGFHALELRTLSNSNNLPELFSSQFETTDKFADYIKAKRVRICAMDTSFNLVGHNERDREALIDHVKWADAGEVYWLRVFDGGDMGDPEIVEKAAKTLEWWREQRIKNGYGVDLIMETCDSILTNQDLDALIKRVPFVNILWDTHHTWKKAKMDPLETWGIIKNRTYHIHVKDSISQPSTHHPYSYVLPGDGEFPMPSLRKILKETGYDGVISLEWERMWHPYLPPLDKALHVAHMRNWW